jgi:DNA-binding NarL/FixJ family response regulator
MTTESEVRVKQSLEPCPQPDATDKIRVVVADNHPGFREGLCRLLAEEEEIQIIGQAADGKELTEVAARLKPDVAIVDVAMPNMTGIEATRYILESSPCTAVIIVSAFGYQNYILASLRAGAVGYLTKDTPVKRLFTAIRVAHTLPRKGRPDKTVMRQLIAGGDVYRKNQALTADEVRLLKQLARGLPNDEISKALGTSESSVNAGIASILHKLNATSRTDALIEALKEGWLTADDLV